MMATYSNLAPQDRVLANISGIATHNAATRTAMGNYSSRGKAAHFSTFGKLVGWVGYWACSSVNFHHVNSVGEMTECRRWNDVTRAWADNISDLEMWAALVEWRAERKHALSLEQVAA